MVGFYRKEVEKGAINKGEKGLFFGQDIFLEGNQMQRFLFCRLPLFSMGLRERGWEGGWKVCLGPVLNLDVESWAFSTSDTTGGCGVFFTSPLCLIQPSLVLIVKD